MSNRDFTLQRQPRQAFSSALCTPASGRQHSKKDEFPAFADRKEEASDALDDVAGDAGKAFKLDVVACT